MRRAELLAPGEADAARAEIARRLLRSSAASTKPPVSEPAIRHRFAQPVYVITSIALPAVSLALYLTYGAPGLPGQPLSERLAEFRQCR